MKYYFKKLGHQELGSVGANGKANRGRYIYISKDLSVLEFFPPLSSVITNDCALLPIIPLYMNKKVYCNYVYHNDKLTSACGTRNEYRIYLNADIEDNELLMKTNDIIIMKKDEITLDDEVQAIYFFDVVSNHDLAIYKFCNEQISSSSIRGEHCVYEGEIPEFEGRVTEIKKQRTVDVLIDKSVTGIIEKNEPPQMENLFNASSFRDFVLVGYSNVCAVSKSVIKWNTYNNLEAAHIKPRSHGGFFLPDNGIAMCRDIHWAFDKGFFTISDNYKIVVHKEIESDFLRSFHDKQILLPTNQFFIPNKENLRYHRENVFGLFKTTGRL